jgi:hypothetical protein
MPPEGLPPGDVPLGDLPRIDEHAVRVAGGPDAAWDAVVRTLGAAFGRSSSRRIARVLGCDPAGTESWERPGVGSAVPGFRIVTADRPRLLVVAGRHRFSRYGIVFRFEPDGAGTRCRAESRAAFPGVAGLAYRTGVISTGGHVLAVRSLLHRVRAAAEQG